MLALLISLPTAISYAMVSNEIPAAGQAYTWLWHAFRPGYWLWTGAILVLYYVSGLWIVKMLFAVFFVYFFFFNDTATTEIYTLSLHDALPICEDWMMARSRALVPAVSGSSN